MKDEKSVLVCLLLLIFHLHRKVQKFSSGTGWPGGPGKRAIKRLWWWCGNEAEGLFKVKAVVYAEKME